MQGFSTWQHGGCGYPGCFFMWVAIVSLCSGRCCAHISTLQMLARCTDWAWWWRLRVQASFSTVALPRCSNFKLNWFYLVPCWWCNRWEARGRVTWIQQGVHKKILSAKFEWLSVFWIVDSQVKDCGQHSGSQFKENWNCVLDLQHLHRVETCRDAICMLEWGCYIYSHWIWNLHAWVSKTPHHFL